MPCKCIQFKRVKGAHHENRADGISNCLDSHMPQASFSHGHHDNSFPQNPACNEICEGMMDLLSAAFYGAPAPYMNNNDVKAEVGDKAHAGSWNPHHVTKMHGNDTMTQDFGNAQVVDSSLEYLPDDLPGKK